MKKIPFKTTPKFEIKAIGNERTGVVYLKSINAITPAENPMDFQENKRRQNKFLLRLNQRIKQLATEQNVPVPEMRKRVMSSMTPDTDVYSPLSVLVSSVAPDDEFNTDDIKNSILLLKVKNIWWVGIYSESGDAEVFLKDNPKAKGFSDFLDKEFNGVIPKGKFVSFSKKAEKQIKSYVGFLDLLPKDAEVVDDKNEIFDFLDSETAELLFNLNNEDSEAIAKKAATFMLANRVCYSVTLKADAVAGSTSLLIETTQDGIEKGLFIKFGDIYVKTSSAYTNGVSSVLKVEDIPTNLSNGDVGFVCDSNKNLNVGYDSWTVEDTAEYMPIELINFLHDFYKQEAGLMDSEESEEPEGNLLTGSQKPLNLTLSTGNESSIDSNGSDVQTLDSSPGKSLVTSQ